MACPIHRSCFTLTFNVSYLIAIPRGDPSDTYTHARRAESARSFNLSNTHIKILASAINQTLAAVCTLTTSPERYGSENDQPSTMSTPKRQRPATTHVHTKSTTSRFVWLRRLIYVFVLQVHLPISSSHGTTPDPWPRPQAPAPQ